MNILAIASVVSAPVLGIGLFRGAVFLIDWTLEGREKSLLWLREDLRP